MNTAASVIFVVRAFWSLERPAFLEPQAYLAKTARIRQNAAKPRVMMHEQSFRPHFAVSTCCTVLSSHCDDTSWIQYEALFLLSMKSREKTFYCSSLLQMRRILSRTCSSDRSPLVGPEFLEISRQDTDKETCCMQARLFGKRVKAAPVKGRSGEHWITWQMTPPAACLKGHSWIQNVCQVMCLIWTWKCNNIFQASSVIFSLCYSIKGDLVLLSVFFCRNNRFFNVNLRIAMRPSFHNIQPNKYKEKQKRLKR